MALYRLTNYTRYNSDDLEALIDAVEAVLPGLLGYSLRRAFHRGTQEVLDERITLKDYSPSKPTKEVRSYQRVFGKTTITHRRLYVKTCSFWRATGDLRIVRPDKLWSSPEEALAACSQANGSCIPAGALEQLLWRVAGLYELPYSKSEEEVVGAILSRFPDLRVRYEDKRANTINGAERDRMRRQRALKSVLGMDHYCHKTATEFRGMEDFLSEYVGRKGIPQSETLDKLVLVTRAIRSYLTAAQPLLNELKKELK